MVTKFEEMLEEHGKRNRGFIWGAIIIFLFLLLLLNIMANIMFALFMLETPLERKIEDLLEYRPTPGQHAFALMQFLLISWWVWLYLKSRQIHMRAGFISGHILDDYKRAGMDAPAEFVAWEELETSSSVPRNIGLMIMLVMCVLLLFSVLFSWGSHSIITIFLLSLTAYLLFALPKIKLIRDFLLGIGRSYASEAGVVQAPGQPARIGRRLIEGSVIGCLYLLLINFVFRLSMFDAIFFFLAFLGLYAGTMFIRDMNRYLVLITRFADSVRMRRSEVVIQ